jgi:hypothetical protein
LKKRSVSAKALVEDIRNGLSDAELMSRHEIGYGQLRKLFVQLIEAGYLAPEALDGRRHEETKAASGEFGTNAVQPTQPERRSPGSPHSVRPDSHAATVSPHQSLQPGKGQPGALSLPMSPEQASRCRRNGLILILASFGFLTMATILAKLREGVEPDVFPLDNLGVALGFLATVGAIISVVLGCLWRVRGLGQHAAWAVVAPLFFLNVVVLEALPNRYEPHSDVRALRLAFAVSGVVAWWITLLLVVKLL